MDKLQTIEQFIDNRNAQGLCYESYRGFLQRVNAEKYDDERCRRSFELCEHILKLKHEKGVWIDMHNYVDQDIIGVADGIGDSYKLAVLAQQIPRGAVTPDAALSFGGARGFAFNVPPCSDPRITARVGIGPTGHGGFGLQVALDLHAPHLSSADAAELMARADQRCPYSNATRGNIEVTLTVV